MKKTLLITFSTLLYFNANAQTNIFPPSGSVGIGTIMPSAKLNVQGDAINESEGQAQVHITGASNPNKRLRIGFNTTDNYGFIQALESGVNYRNLILNAVSGNVGIGTTSPASRLHIEGGQEPRSVQTVFPSSYTTGTTVAGLRLSWYGDYWDLLVNRSSNASIEDFKIARNNVEYFRIKSNGDVGIGTSNPAAKLEVNNGTILVRNYSNTDGESAIMIGHSINVPNYSTFGTSLRTITQNAGTNVYGLQFFTQESYAAGQTEKLRINGNGNVGIGTTTPTEKLSVNGKIRAQEIKVESANWPDYVFEEDYQPASLQETEAYIKTHKHLPEMPSEAEVKAEGISLGEMNAKLLKKIEELTLHLIDLNKKVEAQDEKHKKEIETLKQSK